MDLTQQLTDLAHARERVAHYAKDIGEHELAGRLLKADLIDQFRREGVTKTDSEQMAKVNPKYLDHERQGLELTYLRDVTHAQAERLRFTVLAAITTMADNHQLVVGVEDVR